MSEQHSTEYPLFQINKKMYQQLLKLQPENYAFPERYTIEKPNPRGTQTNQNDH